MKTSRVVITGANGQLGRSLMKIAPDFPNLILIPTDVPESDITDRIQLFETIPSLYPDFIVNCAAFTAVDDAEENQEAAYQVNQAGPNNLAFLCKKLDIPLIHISTDYVFSGNANNPYEVDDPTGPVTIYGKSKLAGEQAVLKSGAKAVIIRTSWLYSEFGHNFVKSMLRLGNEKEELSVVNDQLGSPTYAGDLAQAILTIIEKGFSTSGLENKISIYHFSNSGSCTWYDLASAVMEISNIECNVKPVSSIMFKRPAKRPAYSVFDTSKIEKDFNLGIPHWRKSLGTCLQSIKHLKK